jgi:hypothetical protein
MLTTPAAAQVILDDTADFLPTYAGAQNGDLDIALAAAMFDGFDFGLISIQQDGVGLTPDASFVWGINRGAGSAGLVAGSPSVGAGVLFDALVIFKANGSGSVITFGPGGSVTTALAPAQSFENGFIVGNFVSTRLLPSTGFAFEDYQFNLWTRDAGGNAHIADFALDGGTFGAFDTRLAVPEPASWALMITGFGLAGGAIRRRRALTAT